MTLFRIASALLGYPDATLRTALPEILEAIERAACVSAEERAVLTHFADSLSAADPVSAEADYVSTFDMVPEHSLHLTHHLIGEDKNRGPALIDLTEFFKAHGFEVRDNELPDYLPLLLEFVSLLGAEAGLAFLARWNKVLRQLRANLADAKSPYAELIGLVETRSRPAGADDAADASPAAKQSQPCLDDGDFHPQVSWSPPAACAPSRVPQGVPIRLHARAAEFPESPSPLTPDAEIFAHD